MAIVSFTQEFQKPKFNGFEKLKVEKGSTDRVAIVTAPERFYVHQMNMPIVLPDGEIEQEEMKNAKGEPYLRDKTEFVGAYLCTGKDENITGPDGFDPENCTLCAAIKEHGADKFRRPEPKFACYVIRYKMNSSGEPQLDPFQAELLLWVMTQHRFDQIVSIANEHGDPMKLDLLLGPCKNTLFQAYEIAAGGKCYWRADAERAASGRAGPPPAARRAARASRSPRARDRGRRARRARYASAGAAGRAGVPCRAARAAPADPRPSRPRTKRPKRRLAPI